jgi:hypothetical protein
VRSWATCLSALFLRVSFFFFFFLFFFVFVDKKYGTLHVTLRNGILENKEDVEHTNTYVIVKIGEMQRKSKVLRKTKQLAWDEGVDDEVMFFLVSMCFNKWWFACSFCVSYF